ncbi:MAG: hypothetical protein J0H99_04005 [Rhodospirillales bacterium]|nr:hypothetical protein [Rhodospirillales bacterium]
MRLNNIRRLLSVSAIDDKDAAARLNEVDAEMEKVWQELSAHMVPPINSQIKAEGTKPGGQTATRPPVPPVRATA